MARLSAAWVLLVVAVPLFLYTSALLVIIELGRGAAERRPDGIGVSINIKGVVQYLAKISLSDGEHVTAVEGTIGHFSNVPGVFITSLTFRTSTGKTYGPYGGNQGGARPASFSVPAADGGCIVGFWGRSGWLLDAIGVYVRPCKRTAPSYISSRTPPEMMPKN